MAMLMANQTLDTSFHTRRLAAELKDTHFRAEYERVRAEIDHIDQRVKPASSSGRSASGTPTSPGGSETRRRLSRPQ